jgi:hypothetical protein
VGTPYLNDGQWYVEKLASAGHLRTPHLRNLKPGPRRADYIRQCQIIDRPCGSALMAKELATQLIEQLQAGGSASTALSATA